MICILLNLVPDLSSDGVVGECEHSTVRLYNRLAIFTASAAAAAAAARGGSKLNWVTLTYVVYNYYLPRPKQLLRDDDAAQGIGDSSACVADDMGVAFF